MTLLPNVRRQLYQAAEQRTHRRFLWRAGRVRVPSSRGRGLMVALVAVLSTSAVAYAASQIVRATLPRTPMPRCTP